MGSASLPPGRAFAAELLAPSEGIAEIVGRRVTEDRIALGGATFGVSSYVIEHQLENQGARWVPAQRRGGAARLYWA